MWTYAIVFLSQTAKCPRFFFALFACSLFLDQMFYKNMHTQKRMLSPLKM